jgi:hypothetical protein
MGRDGSSMFHLGNQHVVSSSPQHHHQHHRMMIDASQQQVTPSQHQYLNQGFVMQPSPNAPCRNSQYIAQWE